MKKLISFEHMNKSTEELYKLAFTDQMTGCYNRNMLEEMRSRLETMSLYVTIVDIDGLKTINDTQGHSAGDVYIQEVVEDMRDISDCIFRLGGDEFLIITDHPVQFQMTHASVGTVYKSHQTTLHEVMKEADSRMYIEKRVRKGCLAR